ncbi:MAG: 50S ribosomal protein L24 [Bacteroidetes bacterium]|jgi:large subunit ribosomal protein L24|nr:50S ribosomal protein L24 [Bacteroidota bacterium]
MAVKLHIKKNDTVRVITGNARGTMGKVLKVYPETNRVIVEGVNIRIRHTKPNATYPQGGRIEKEAPVNASNLMLVCPKCSASTRVAHKMITEENTGKLKSRRACKKCGELID